MATRTVVVGWWGTPLWGSRSPGLWCGGGSSPHGGGCAVPPQRGPLRGAEPGHPEEAVAVPEPDDQSAFAAHLMTAGRVEDVVALFRERPKYVGHLPLSSEAPPFQDLP